jgi:hypothetical protein
VDCIIELAWTVVCLWQKKKKERDSRVEMSGSTFDPDKWFSDFKATLVFQALLDDTMGPVATRFTKTPKSRVRP